MTKNPFINALAAIAYIFLVASVMYLGSQHANPDDSVFAPMVLLSLFTLSAAVMGYLFVFQPLQLYLDGKKKAAVNLFLQTLLTFAGLTAVLVFLLFSGILP